jgi:peptide/nickel transport system substrate-binding protein
VQSSVAVGDPHIASDSSNRRNILHTVYESLVRQGDDGSFQPSLAESWTVGEDPREWTFSLRGGVSFHNGDMLGAEDVVATLGRVLDPSIGGSYGTQGVYLSYLGGAEITAPDAQTVRIRTEKPMADLLDLLVAMPISPASELASLPHRYVGSGPYRIREQGERRVIVERFDDYWGQPARYDEIRWIPEPDPGRRVDSLLDGRADVAFRIGLGGKERIAGNPDVIAHESETGLCIIFMLSSGKGACRDPRVRQALNYAVDVERIIDEIKGGAAKPLNGYLTPHHFGYNPETPAYPYDPEKARSLLRAAGFGGGLKLVFDIPMAMPDEAPRLAGMMAEQLSQVGVSLEIVEHHDRAAYSETVREKRIHDGCCFDSSPASTYRVLREKLHSSLAGPWWQGYENTTVDALIEKAEATFDDAERQRIYREIYSITRDDAPWIFLYRPTRFVGARSSMGEWRPTAGGLLRF